jgi:Flp pilus assembly CpaF family ATPase
LGAAVAIHSIQSEAISRGARMLRTAFGPAIARFLEDPDITEVMLNPDGRLWVDRLSSGLADIRVRSAALVNPDRLGRLMTCSLTPLPRLLFWAHKLEMKEQRQSPS